MRTDPIIDVPVTFNFVITISNSPPNGPYVDNPLTGYPEPDDVLPAIIKLPLASTTKL